MSNQPMFTNMKEPHMAMLKEKSNDRAIEVALGFQKKDSKEDNMHYHSDQFLPLQPAPVEAKRRQMVSKSDLHNE